jgi:oligopeptide transport system substrate-binding protein
MRTPRHVGSKATTSETGPSSRSTFPAHTAQILLFLLLFTATSLFAAETPRRGGTLRLWFPQDWRSLDPAIGFDGDSIPLQKLLFRGLIDFDATGTRLVPDQASDWNISPDGKTYTFHLKPGVRFSNGRAVEAEDYVFSLERILDPRTGSVGQSYFMDIAGAKEFTEGTATHVAGLRAPDPRTLVIQLAKPSFTFRYMLTMMFASALPRDVVRQQGANFRSHLIGSGPYQVKEWRRDVRWRFERNPQYSGTEGWVDSVDIQFGGDVSLRVMMVERGEIDRTKADAVSALRHERDPRLRSSLHWVTSVNTGYLFLNTEMKPFDDPRVRQAMNHAIDKRRLMQLAGGLAVAADSVVPPSMPWTNPGLPSYEYSPDKARALLREAGLPNGFKTGLWFINARAIDRRLAEGMQQELRAVGIEVQLEGINQSAFEVKARSRRQVACGIWSWSQDYPDPSNFLDVLLNGDRITDQDCNNLAFYSNPEVNRRLALAGDSFDPAVRLQLFREAESLVMQDAPWVPLYHQRDPIIRHPRLRGDVPHPVYLWRYENMWLAE